jgi:hypothetical protein
MSKPIKPKSPAPGGTDRQARLAAELRANLLKRKAFARGKASDGQGLDGDGKKIGPTPDDATT